MSSSDPLKIGAHTFESRLFVGTGKYRDVKETAEALGLGEEAVQHVRQRHAAHELLGAVLYLMCDNLHVTLKWLAGRGVTATEVEREDWGLRTTIRLPSGGELGLYQPTHPSPLPRG